MPRSRPIMMETTTPSKGFNNTQFIADLSATLGLHKQTLTKLLKMENTNNGLKVGSARTAYVYPPPLRPRSEICECGGPNIIARARSDRIFRSWRGGRALSVVCYSRWIE